MFKVPSNEALSLDLYYEIEREYPSFRISDVISKYKSDIDKEFLGFLQPYWFLSQVLDKDLTIIDLGCGYGLQSYYFRKFKRYIGIDVLSFVDNIEELKPTEVIVVKLPVPNAEYYSRIINNMTKADFQNIGVDFNNSFAIVSYSIQRTHKVCNLFTKKYVYY